MACARALGRFGGEVRCAAAARDAAVERESAAAERASIEETIANADEATAKLETERKACVTEVNERQASLDVATSALNAARAVAARLAGRFADAKKRLAEVEAAAQSLRSGADAVRQKFQQLESENATLRASGNGVEFEPEDRFVYLKNLMCEYLATAPEDSARAPMERAMKAVIGFDDSDAKRLEAKKAEHAKRALGGLAVFFGGSG